MIRFTRRAFTAALLALGLASAGTGTTLAAAYPDKPINFVVPYPAGGATDIVGRLLAQKLSEAWKVPVVVENKPGAGGTIGNNTVVRAAPDGYTVLVAITALVQQIPLMKLPYDPLKDLAPITRVAVSPSILAVTKNTPAANVAELVSLVKSNPGQYNYGTYGPGTSSHLQGALFNYQNNLDLAHIPFKGAAPLITAFMGDHVKMAFLDAGSSRPQLPNFKLLGVTGEKRLAWLPDVPTLKEQGQKMFEPMGWFGIFLPAATPTDIQKKLSDELIRIIKSPEVTKRIEDLGLIPGGDDPEAFKKILVNDAGIYAEIVKSANVVID